ncbi:MAG: DUF484 family protein [Azospirillaceae bacterium]
MARDENAEPVERSPADQGDATPSEAAVARFLLAHPDFLDRHPEVLNRLSQAGAAEAVRPDGAIDFQTYMVGRLRGEVDRLRQGQQEILGLSRQNETNLQRVHTAALYLLDATSFEELIQTVTADLAVILDVDIIALLVEARGDEPLPPTPAGVRLVDHGLIDEVIGQDEIVLEDHVAGDERIFGGGANLVKSQLLVRIAIAPESPPCLLALGSRDPETYQPGMRTDLVHFLARVLERCIRGWLDLAS